jgi:hypothetical protein
MSVAVLDMSMSLDGNIADPHDFLGGDDGERLHDSFGAGGEAGRLSGPAELVEQEWNAAGAVLAGRRTAELDVLPAHVELEIVRVIDTPEATHIRYRVPR